MTFTILRAHVDPVPESAASSYELTQPLMIFTGPGISGEAAKGSDS